MHKYRRCILYEFCRYKVQSSTAADLSVVINKSRKKKLLQIIFNILSKKKSAFAKSVKNKKKIKNEEKVRKPLNIN